MFFSSSPVIVTAPGAAGEALTPEAARGGDVTVAQADSARRIMGMNSFMATPSKRPNVNLALGDFTRNPPAGTASRPIGLVLTYDSHLPVRLGAARDSRRRNEPARPAEGLRHANILVCGRVGIGIDDCQCP